VLHARSDVITLVIYFLYMNLSVTGVFLLQQFCNQAELFSMFSNNVIGMNTRKNCQGLQGTKTTTFIYPVTRNSPGF